MVVFLFNYKELLEQRLHWKVVEQGRIKGGNPLGAIKLQIVSLYS